MPTELKNIPKEHAQRLIGEAIIDELDRLIETLDLEIIKLRGLKKELLKLQ